jgi:hypothetical protein
MSYLRTKPKYCPTVEATEQGWINSTTGELLVSLRNLKSLLAAEEAATQAPAVETPKEVIMQVEETVPVVAEVQVPLKEETIKKPKKKQKLLGEVVEFPTDAEVIGE